MANYNKFTFYWHWHIGRLTFMIWFQGWRLAWLMKSGFYRRLDGGWVLNLFPDISIQWNGRGKA